MTLKELRERWESCPGRGPHKVSLEVPRTDPSQELYVVFTDRGEIDDYGRGEARHRLLHYFLIGDNWTVSVDVDWTKDIYECLRVVSGAMVDLVPA